MIIEMGVAVWLNHI